MVQQVQESNMDKPVKKCEPESIPAKSRSQKFTAVKNTVMETLVFIAKLVDWHLPHIIRAYEVLSEYLAIGIAKWKENFNSDMNHVMLGFFLCFYGGSFPALLTTVTAIYQSGQWGSLKKGVITAYNEFKEACGVLKEDEIVKALDKNKDGQVSFLEIVMGFKKGGKGLVVTVMPLIIQKVDPNVMNEAITSIWTIWCLIMITLRSMFAREIAMGMQVGDVISNTMKVYVAPAIAQKVDNKWKIWVNYSLLIGCKFVGVLVAMILQKLLGAFACAMLGGEIFAKGMMPMMSNYVKLSLDEAKNWQSITTYMIGGIGFLYQLKSGFTMNIIFQLLLAPAVILEMVIALFVYTA